jgi:L-threonylcarbamoyladenylate synthase
VRLGKVTAEDVEHATGMQLGGSSQVRAPGMLAAHYSPRASVLLVEEAEVPERAVPSGAGLIAPSGVSTPPGLVRLSEPATTEEYAADLYRAFREADSLQLSTVVVVPPSGAGLADAVRDRITRAAHA